MNADFADVSKAINDGGATIIDVRQPNERKADGKIPSSVNLPLPQLPDALRLSEEEFMSRYGYARPSDHQPLILHCMAGVRAAKAASVLAQEGYSNMRVYKGSFLDWVNQGGPVERD